MRFLVKYFHYWKKLDPKSFNTTLQSLEKLKMKTSLSSKLGRKPKVFWCFQGDRKGTFRRKGLKPIEKLGIIVKCRFWYFLTKLGIIVKSSENSRFFNNFRGNRSWIICLISLNIRGEIWQQPLTRTMFCNVIRGFNSD